MKQIKLFIFAALAFIAGTTMTSCTDYQDEIDALDKRVTKLEEMANTMQKRLDAFAFLVEGMGDNWVVSDYIPIIEDNKVVGYIINLRKDKYDPVTGQIIPEEREEKSIEIRDGEKGEDAQFPDIEPRRDKDGNWYWVVINPDGTERPLTDENGKPIIIGKDGKDAVAPKIRINPLTLEWEISTDNGETWVPTGVSATGDKGATGPKGEPGADAESAIVSIEIVDGTNGKQLKFTTKNGTTFYLPYIPA